MFAVKLNMFTFAAESERLAFGNSSTMKRTEKIDRLLRAGWHVRYTNNIDKKRILATRKGIEHRGSVNKVHLMVFGY